MLLYLNGWKVQHTVIRTKTKSKYSNHENNLSLTNEIRTIKAKGRERPIWAAWWRRGGQAAVEAEQIDDEALTGVKDLRGSFIFVLHRFSYLSGWIFEFDSVWVWDKIFPILHFWYVVENWIGSIKECECVRWWKQWDVNMKGVYPCVVETMD